MAGRAQARRLVEQALASAAGVVDPGTHKALEARLKQFDATQDEEAGVAILHEIAGVLAIAQGHAKQAQNQTSQGKVGDSDDEDEDAIQSTGRTSGKESIQQKQEEEEEEGKKKKSSATASNSSQGSAPSQPNRYEHVRKLMRDEPEVFAWAKDLATRLMRDNYVVLPRLLGPELAPALAHEVKTAYEEGRLSSGMLGGGRTGANTKYILSAVRGDKVGWFDEDPCHDTSQRDEMPLPAHVADSDDEDDSGENSDQESSGSKGEGADGSGENRGDGVKCWRGTALKAFSRKMNTIVQLIAALVPELKHLESRSKAMVTCYPGNGARYIRHCDNPHGNGRKLTVLYYLNDDWKNGDGGELRVFKPQRGDSEEEGRSAGDGEGEADKGDGSEGQQEAETEPLEDIPPRLDTMIIFFSDTRVPHEVLPTHRPRFAVTHWFYDAEEKRRAEQNMQHTRTGAQADLEIEEARLRREIERFEAKYGSKANVTAKGKEKAAEEARENEESAKQAEKIVQHQQRQRQQREQEQEQQREEQQREKQQRHVQQQRQQQEEQPAAGHALKYRVSVDDAAGTQTVVVEPPPARDTPARGTDFGVEIEEDMLHVTFHPTLSEIQVPLPLTIDPDSDGHKVQFRKTTQTLHVALQVEEK